LNVNSDYLGIIVNISGRSFRDWINERTLGEKNKLVYLSKISGILLPDVVDEREEWWSGKINGRSGALARMKLYGPPGVGWGRKKGGQISQLRRRENPEKYRVLGCNVSRQFKLPRKTKLLAEFFGIILGDGGLTNAQLKIILNSVADCKYMQYVIKRSVELFGYKPYVYKVKNAKANTLNFSGVELVKFFERNGLVVGNKVVHQVDVPFWIRKNRLFSTWCLRGLMDTDGGAFVHTYRVNGKKYEYLKINFTNRSQPLLKFVHNTLSSLGLSPKFQSDNKVWLYSRHDVFRYFDVIGSSNYRLISKLKMI